MDVFKEIKYRVDGKSLSAGMAIVLAMFSTLLIFLYNRNILTLKDVQDIVNVEVSWKL